MNINNKYQSDSVSYNSLERELSTRINHPDKNLNILTEQLSEIKPKKKKHPTKQTNKKTPPKNDHNQKPNKKNKLI